MVNSFARTRKRPGFIYWLLLLVWALEIWYNVPMEKQDYFADIIVLCLIMTIGAAEAAHLSGVFFRRSLSECTVIFGLLAVLAVAALFFWTAVRRRKASSPGESRGGRTSLSRSETILLFLFAVLAVSQIFFIVSGKNVYMQGDMTVETAQGFLETDAVYGVNPMTGRAYESGLPARIEILCLPTLYAMLSRIFHIRPDVLVWQVIPVITLLGCYGAYICLAKGLFPENRKKRLCFLAAAAFLIWIGSSSYGMEGFGLLFSGWRGVSIRNGVLVPYTVSLCLREKYIYLPICILAEICIVWTLYGMGACLPVSLGMMLVSHFVRKRRAGREAADGGTS